MFEELSGAIKHQSIDNYTTATDTPNCLLELKGRCLKVGHAIISNNVLLRS